MVSVLTAGLLASCSAVDPEQSVIDNGYIYTITYEAPEGQFDTDVDAGDEEGGDSGEEDEEDQPVQADETYLRVSAESPAIEPGVPYTGVPGDGIVLDAPTREGYTVDHWVLVTTNDDGTESTRVWNFETDRVTDNIVLRAVWRRNVYVVITANIDGQDVALYNMIITEPGTTTGPGSILRRLYDTREGQYVYSDDGTFRPDYIVNHFSTFTYEEQEYTPLAFYWMEDGQRVELTEENAVYEQSYYDNGENKILYAEVIEGNFTMVTQEIVDNQNLSLNAVSNWYLLEDVGFGITFENGTPRNAITQFNGAIYGNGHTISNMWFRTNVTATGSALSSSIFGTMNGVVRDVTFENVGLIVSTGFFTTPTGKQMDISLLANSFTDVGRFDGVTLSDCSINIVNNVVDDTVKFTCNFPNDGYYWFSTNTLVQDVTGEVAVNYSTDDSIR